MLTRTGWSGSGGQAPDARPSQNGTNAHGFPVRLKGRCLKLVIREASQGKSRSAAKTGSYGRISAALAICAGLSPQKASPRGACFCFSPSFYTCYSSMVFFFLVFILFYLGLQRGEGGHGHSVKPVHVFKHAPWPTCPLPRVRFRDARLPPCVPKAEALSVVLSPSPPSTCLVSGSR
ncbi:hypothetical protein LZ30DRAFT_51668 [Colletotrichum cereale]|nr:hypothetical protein LZ30DRAFT_51668 [Colletotrichum cereale]